MTAEGAALWNFVYKIGSFWLIRNGIKENSRRKLCLKLRFEPMLLCPEVLSHSMESQVRLSGFRVSKALLTLGTEALTLTVWHCLNTGLFDP